MRRMAALSRPAKSLHYRSRHMTRTSLTTSQTPRCLPRRPRPCSEQPPGCQAVIAVTYTAPDISIRSKFSCSEKTRADCRKEPFDVYWRILSYMHVIYDSILQYRVFFCTDPNVQESLSPAFSQIRLFQAFLGQSMYVPHTHSKTNRWCAVPGQKRPETAETGKCLLQRVSLVSGDADRCQVWS